MPQIASSPIDESNNVSSTTGDGTGDTTTTTPSQIILNNNNNKTPPPPPPIHNNNINVSYQNPYLINPSSNNLHLSSSTGLVWVTQPHPLSPSGGGSAIEDDDQLLPHHHQQQQQVHHEDHELNYCTDEVFSSFLNSLINEDMFTAPAPPSTTIDHHGSATTDGLLHNTSSSSSSPMVMMTSNQVVGFGSFGAAGWDAPPLMSTLSTVVSSYHGGEGEDKTFIYMMMMNPCGLLAS